MRQLSAEKNVPVSEAWEEILVDAGIIPRGRVTPEQGALLYDRVKSVNAFFYAFIDDLVGFSSTSFTPSKGQVDLEDICFSVSSRYDVQGARSYERLRFLTILSATHSF